MTNPLHTHWIICFFFIVVLASSLSVLADEGMWLFDHPPRALLKKHYDFDATDAWLSHVMHSAVRFNSGGSGSFVSSDGLVMTNHHVGAGALQKLSKAGQDFVAKGFHARTRAEEIKCVDMELNVLIDIRDVTARVKDAIKPEMDTAQSHAARRAVMSTIEQESFKES